MILPDVLNTLLLGLIFMVVLVTVVRPLVLNAVGNPIYTDAQERAMLCFNHGCRWWTLPCSADVSSASRHH